jgi:hypothetical protein
VIGYHAILLDGVFASAKNGALEFHPPQSLSTAELADLLQVVRVRVLGWLCRRGSSKTAHSWPSSTRRSLSGSRRWPPWRAAVSGLAPASSTRSMRTQERRRLWRPASDAERPLYCERNPALDGSSRASAA